MKIVGIALCILFVNGCGISRHSGKVEFYDSDGKLTGHYVVTMDRPMLLEATDGKITAKADSRGNSSWGQFVKGMMEIVTLGLLVDK